MILDTGKLGFWCSKMHFVWPNAGGRAFAFAGGRAFARGPLFSKKEKREKEGKGGKKEEKEKNQQFSRSFYEICILKSLAPPKF